MKRRDLIRHLEIHGCVLVREGHSHTIFENPANDRRAPVPRHREIPQPIGPRDLPATWHSGTVTRPEMTEWFISPCVHPLRNGIC